MLKKLIAGDKARSERGEPLFADKLLKAMDQGRVLTLRDAASEDYYTHILF